MLTFNVKFPRTAGKHEQSEQGVIMTLYRALEEHYSLTKLHCWRQKAGKKIDLYLRSGIPIFEELWLVCAVNALCIAEKEEAQTNRERILF